MRILAGLAASGMLIAVLLSSRAIGDTLSSLPSDYQAQTGGRNATTIAGVRFTFAPLPRYPRPHTVHGNGPEGKGLFALQFDGSTGKVRAVRIVRSTGFETLDAAAVRALRLWRVKIGIPRSEVVVPIAFTNFSLVGLPE